MKASRTRSIISFVVSGLLIAAAIFVFTNQRQISDQIKVWSYQPSSGIAEINKNSGFTEKGSFIFYATAPELKRQDSFNKACPRQEEGSPILGCYTSNDQIFIYEVNHPQLEGMKEVTAIHEMLHAVWYRNDKAFQDKLVTEIRAVYDQLDDSDIKDRIKYYERTEPDEINNELHSILGTEVPNLSDFLEDYYSQYFNRQTVLGLHAQYSNVYKDLNAQAKDIYEKMGALSVSIESRGRAYDAALVQYVADVNSFNQRADNGGFVSQSQFYNERGALIARMNLLESDRQAINRDVDNYNDMRDRYEEISEQIQVLNDNLDSMKQVEAAPAV